jgi:hypothetical protein
MEARTAEDVSISRGGTFMAVGKGFNRPNLLVAATHFSVNLYVDTKVSAVLGGRRGFWYLMLDERRIGCGPPVASISSRK